MQPTSQMCRDQPATSGPQLQRVGNGRTFVVDVFAIYYHIRACLVHRDEVPLTCVQALDRFQYNGRGCGGDELLQSCADMDVCGVRQWNQLTQ